MYQHDSCENMKDFIVTSPHIMQHPNKSQSQLRTMNVNTIPKREPKNERNYYKMFASQGNITTCHMRHICMPVDITIKKYFCSCNNLLNATFQSHPIKMGCCNTNSQHLIVTTINPIWRSHPVHHGTNNLTICSYKSKGNIILAHNINTCKTILLYLNCFLLVTHLNLMRRKKCD